MSAPIPQAKRQEILDAVKNGLSIPEASGSFHVTIPTIQKWIRQGSKNAHTSTSESQKNKKEIEFLRSVILDLILEQKALSRKG
jgi:transposase